ncbi:MAG: hypothetical protein WCP07_12195, partial [bacterium]
DAIPSLGERRWRELALQPEARFALDEERSLDYGDGLSYLPLPLASLGEEGITFRDAAISAVRHASGLLLCREWPPTGQISRGSIDDHLLWLRFGDLVDYLLTGELERRRLASREWLVPGEYYEGRLTKPDENVLPLVCRYVIGHMMEIFGVTRHTVSLQTIPGQERKYLLHFSGYETLKDEPEALDALRAAIHWCLPRYYTVWMMDSENYVPWPLSLDVGEDSPQIDEINLSMHDDSADEIIRTPNNE